MILPQYFRMLVVQPEGGRFLSVLLNALLLTSFLALHELNYHTRNPHSSNGYPGFLDRVGRRTKGMFFFVQQRMATKTDVHANEIFTEISCWHEKKEQK